MDTVNSVNIHFFQVPPYHELYRVNTGLLPTDGWPGLRTDATLTCHKAHWMDSRQRMEGFLYRIHHARRFQSVRLTDAEIQFNYGYMKSKRHKVRRHSSQPPLGKDNGNSKENPSDETNRQSKSKVKVQMELSYIRTDVRLATATCWIKLRQLW